MSSTDKVIEIFKKHIEKTYSDSCFRKGQCLDMLELISSKLKLCVKKDGTIDK